LLFFWEVETGLERIDVPTLVRSEGYPLEVHNVTTADGYVLSMHRIHHPRAGPGATGGVRRPVLLHHGIIGCSADFLVNNPPLAYQLADAGYDVWLANARGNLYSRRHRTLQEDDPAFWSFSLDQIAEHDLPAAIEYVLATSGAPTLKFVGFDTGSSLLFALPAYRPDLVEKVSAAAALAPVVYQANARIYSNRAVAYVVGKPEDVFASKGWTHNIPGIDRQTVNCGAADSYVMSLCVRILNVMGGSGNTDQYNREVILKAQRLSPGGASMRAYLHYRQNMGEDNFRRFDYGTFEDNRKYYGSDKPPAYDLSRVSIPMALFSGSLDILSTPEDVRTLASELPNVVMNVEISEPGFNHFHFFWGKDAPTLVNNRVLKFFQDMDEKKVGK